MSDTDWIKPGAAVVVYQTTNRNPARTAKKTTIDRVAKLSFTVADGERFKIDTLESKAYGDTWSRYYYRCVPGDSDKARQLLVEQRRLFLEYKALEACEQWTRDRTEANRLAAIEALTKLGEFGPRPEETP